jgi:uncharacterized protein YndB with AHSA1/START domain
MIFRPGRGLITEATGSTKEVVMAKAETVRKATGRTQQQWYTVLDRWGAAGRPYREISDYLMQRHGLGRWWAQKLIVEYEQDRGVRAPGVRRNGTFEVGASKTVTAPVDDVFEAFVNARQRNRWLTDGKMKLRTSEPGRTARFDWEDGSSRVVVTFDDKGSKATVAVQHQSLTGAKNAQKTKELWRERLNELKAYVEA